MSLINVTLPIPLVAFNILWYISNAHGPPPQPAAFILLNYNFITSGVWIGGSRGNLFCGIWKIVTPNCLKNLSNYFSVKKCFKIDSNFQVFKPIMTEELYRYQHKKVFQLFFTALAKARFESVRVNK